MKPIGSRRRGDHEPCGWCVHAWTVHEHLRAGTDCSVHHCSCRRFRTVARQRLIDRFESYVRGVFYTAAAVLIFGAASVTDIRF